MKTQQNRNLWTPCKVLGVLTLALAVACQAQLEPNPRQPGLDNDPQPPPATQPVYAGQIANSDSSMNFRYIIRPEAPDADVTVIAKSSDPVLEARGPVVVYIEGRAGRVEAEHVNTYVTGKAGGNGSTAYGLFRRAEGGTYSIYHLSPQGGSEADGVVVKIKNGSSRTLDAGNYIDVVLGTTGWRFSNHLNGDEPLAYAGVRDEDIARLKDDVDSAIKTLFAMWRIK